MRKQLWSGLGLAVLLALPLAASAQDIPDADDFDQLESVDDYLQRLDDAHEGLVGLSEFFTLDADDSEPRYTEPLQTDFDVDEFDARFHAILDEGLEFEQQFEDERHSLIRFGFDNPLDALDADVVLRPLRYRFHDGSSMDADDDTELDGTFSTTVPVTRTLLGIDVAVTARPQKDIEQTRLPLDLSGPLETELGRFEVIERDDHHVLLKTDADRDDIDHVEATTEDGRTVASSGAMQTTGGTPDVVTRALADFTRGLDKVRQAARRDRNMPLAAFKKKYHARLQALEDAIDEVTDEDASYIRYTFGVPVTELQLYTPGHAEPWRGQMRLVNADPQDLYIRQDGEDTVIHDADFKPIARLPGDFGRLNDAYFEDEMRFYRFDRAAGEMVPLDYYDVDAMPANHALARMDSQSHWVLLDAAGTVQLAQVTDHDEDSEHGVAVLEADDGHYLLSAQTKTPKKVAYDEIRSAGEGFFRVGKAGRHGYADADGIIVIPAQYDAVHSIDHLNRTAQDELFPVQQDDLWGFVDADNQMVIAPEYEEIVGTFSYGIAVVKDTHGRVGLITPDNRRVGGFQDGNYMSSISSGKRHVSFSNGQFNHRGQRERDPDEDGD